MGTDLSDDDLTSQVRPGWVVLGNGQRTELAGPGARLGARMIDILLLGLVSAVSAVLGLLMGLLVPSDASGFQAVDEFFLWGLRAVFVTILAAAAVEISMVKTRGQTFGKMALDIEIVRFDNGLLPTWGASTKRWFVPWLVPVLLLLSDQLVALVPLVVYFSMLGDERRQGWHDKAAGTLVVEK